MSCPPCGLREPTAPHVTADALLMIIDGFLVFQGFLLGGLVPGVSGFLFGFLLGGLAPRSPVVAHGGAD